MKKPLILTLKIFISVICILGILFLTLNFTVILSTESSIVPRAEKLYSVILVLGAGVKPDGTPSQMLEDRLKTAISLYKSGAATTILMSGDNKSPDYDEVTPMKNYALSHGVSEDAIRCDSLGLSTYESIWRALNVFEYESMVIVSQTYHLSRALYIADSLGVDACGVSASTRAYGGQVWYDFRESVARCKDFVFTIVKPKFE